MWCKGAGFFGVIEREHKQIIRFLQFSMNHDRSWVKTHYSCKSIVFWFNIQSLFVQLNKNVGIFLGRQTWGGCNRKCLVIVRCSRWSRHLHTGAVAVRRNLNSSWTTCVKCMSCYRGIVHCLRKSHWESCTVALHSAWNYETFRLSKKVF